MTGLGNIDDVYKHYLAVIEENQKLRKWCEEFNALDVAKENEQLKLIIKRTKASGNYPGRVSAYKARIINLSEENQQLKELLKEAKDIIEWYKGDCGYKDVPTESVLANIDNAIGEK